MAGCAETTRKKKLGYCIKHDGGHRSGVSPWAPPFFYEGCPKCLQKLAEGKTTRDAGPYQSPKSKFGRGVQALFNKPYSKKLKDKATAEARERAKQYSSDPEVNG